MTIRKSLNMIEKSGLKDLIDTYTFEAYKPKESWQNNIKEAAQRFVDDNNGKWFYIGGQVGSGKTHICTAIVSELLKKGYPARYMLWRDESVKLKSFITESEEYTKAINQFKKVKVLYIDDFFKNKPTEADILLAFEILNYRYINKDLITIISGEHDIDELMDIDSAVGSRIYQRSKEYCFTIPKSESKNYRLGG